MILNAIYGGPGSQVISAATRGYNQPWWKIIAAQGGLSWTQVDLMHKYQRELEAKQAAMSSPTARQVPYTYGS